MHRIHFEEDIKPLSEFRANTASCIQQVQQSKRPVVITHHGKSTAVLIGVAQFEAMTQRLDLLEDIAAGESQIDAGTGVPHDEARADVLRRIAR